MILQNRDFSVSMNNLDHFIQCFKVLFQGLLGFFFNWNWLTEMNHKQLLDSKCHRQAHQRHLEVTERLDICSGGDELVLVSNSQSIVHSTSTIYSKFGWLLSAQHYLSKKKKRNTWITRGCDVNNEKEAYSLWVQINCNLDDRTPSSLLC